MKVYAIPLAQHGFIPKDEPGEYPPRNPVFWYLEDERGKVVDTKPHATREEAEAQARRNGWEVGA